MDVSLSHQCFSPSLSPSLPLSLESIYKKEKIENGKHLQLSIVYTKNQSKKECTIYVVAFFFCAPPQKRNKGLNVSQEEDNQG